MLPASHRDSHCKNVRRSNGIWKSCSDTEHTRMSQCLRRLVLAGGLIDRTRRIKTMSVTVFGQIPDVARSGVLELRGPFATWRTHRSTRNRVCGIRGPHCQRAADTSSIKTQSPSPELLFPGGVNFLLPVLTNGEPSMFVYSPFVGSYQRAVAMDASFDMSTVIVRMVGR